MMALEMAELTYEGSDMTSAQTELGMAVWRATMTELGMSSRSSVTEAWGAGEARAVAEKRRKASDLYCILMFGSIEV